MAIPKSWLTVKKLKEELNKHDDDTVIAIYVQEDMDIARSIKLETKDTEQSYCKGDHVLSYQKIDKVLVIKDE